MFKVLKKRIKESFTGTLFASNASKTEDRDRKLRGNQDASTLRYHRTSENGIPSEARSSTLPLPRRGASPEGPAPTAPARQKPQRPTTRPKRAGSVCNDCPAETLSSAVAAPPPAPRASSLEPRPSNYNSTLSNVKLANVAQRKPNHETQVAKISCSGVFSRVSDRYGPTIWTQWRNEAEGVFASDNRTEQGRPVETTSQNAADDAAVEQREDSRETANRAANHANTNAATTVTTNAKAAATAATTAATTRTAKTAVAATSSTTNTAATVTAAPNVATESITATNRINLNSETTSTVSSSPTTTLPETKPKQCNKDDEKTQKSEKVSDDVSPTKETSPKPMTRGAKFKKCPRDGCATSVQSSWKFCSSCGRSLKPHETFGPPEKERKIKLDSSVNSPSTPRDQKELINATKAGDTRTVFDILLQGVAVNQLDEDGTSALMHACWGDNFDIVRLLVAFDAAVNLREARGYSPLHAACDKSKNEELMDFLVKYGADVKARADLGESILHHAAATDNVNGIHFALRSGVDTDDPDHEGATPLFYAVLCDSIEPLECLLSYGANLNVRSLMGQTSLHRAVFHHKTACVRFLIEEGLKATDRDYEGNSALDFAYASSAPAEIVSLLRDAMEQELLKCSFCEDQPAHIQFHPCRHQYACDECCMMWKKCKCGKVIEKKVDVLLDTEGESAEATEDESKTIAAELARLQQEKEKFNEEKICAVCMDQEKAIVFDCGHMTCHDCSRKMRLCHTCRKPIAKKIKFY